MEATGGLGLFIPVLPPPTRGSSPVKDPGRGRRPKSLRFEAQAQPLGAGEADRNAPSDLVAPASPGRPEGQATVRVSTHQPDGPSAVAEGAGEPVALGAKGVEVEARRRFGRQSWECSGT